MADVYRLACPVTREVVMEASVIAELVPVDEPAIHDETATVGRAGLTAVVAWAHLDAPNHNESVLTGNHAETATAVPVDVDSPEVVNERHRSFLATLQPRVGV